MAERRREAISRAIEDVALELFAERPMAEVTLEQIAASAGVAVRTLYRYFPTKEEIFAGLPRRGAERLAEHIRARPPEESPFEAMRHAVAETAADVDRAELERWLKALANTGDARARVARMALGGSTSGLPEVLAERAGLEPDDLWPSMAANMAATAMVAATRHWAMNGGDLLDHQLEAFDIIGRGLDARPGPSAKTPSAKRARRAAAR